LRYYYDQEFHEDGSTIDLISIGIHAADGREYYAVNREMKWGPITKHGWLMRNVVPYLPQPQEPGPLPQLDWDDPAMKGRKQIADEVLWFLTAVPEEPELWAYYAAFDHVRLAWLWGTMIQMPRRIPMFTNDIRQEQHRLGNPDLPQQSSAQHHALADARHNRVMHEYLIEYERRRGR
jgi:hypothetical protein